MMRLFAFKDVELMRLSKHFKAQYGRKMDGIDVAFRTLSAWTKSKKRLRAAIREERLARNMRKCSGVQGWNDRHMEKKYGFRMVATLSM